MREMLAALWPKYKDKLDLSEFELDGYQTTAAVMPTKPSSFPEECLLLRGCSFKAEETHLGFL